MSHENINLDDIVILLKNHNKYGIEAFVIMNELNTE